MNLYHADLHIHTILSPCGDLFMSPNNIIEAAGKKGLDIIGITDHNTTRQSRLIKELGEEAGIFVLCGAEITTKEEAHCLAFMPDESALNELQEFLDENLQDIPNDEQKFGYQVCVNKEEDIIYQEQKLLISAINKSIDEIEQFVHQRNGIFIPAHINRSNYSVISQLGFVSPDLKVDALELSRHITIPEFIQKNAYLKDYTFIRNSDAHFLEDVGFVCNKLLMKHRNFEEVKMALNGLDGRQIITND